MTDEHSYPSTGIVLDAESVRAEVVEAPDAHDLSAGDVLLIGRHRDDYINEVVRAAVDDHLYDAYDEVRRRVIRRLIRETRG